MTKTRIVIVEDEIIVAEDLKLTLTNFGYDVIAIASTGERAIEIAESEHPDLILMDIVLAGKCDGITTAEQIHAREDIPIIYVTANLDKTLLQRVKHTTPFGYIVKPFNDREVYSNIEIGLFRHRMEKEIKKRDAILFALGLGVEWFLRQFSVNYHSERLESKHPISKDFLPILEHLGIAMELDRIIMFRITETSHEKYALTLTEEWLAENESPLKGNPAVSEMDLGRIGMYPRLFEVTRGESVVLTIADFAEEDRKFFRRYNFLSIAALPIWVQDSLFGLLLFIDSSERTWSDEELEAMRISANILGSAIGVTKSPSVTERETN
jgi:two-component system, response regulator PdtaR